jgi:hypothetical protein
MLILPRRNGCLNTKVVTLAMRQREVSPEKKGCQALRQTLLAHGLTCKYMLASLKSALSLRYNHGLSLKPPKH